MRAFFLGLCCALMSLSALAQQGLEIGLRVNPQSIWIFNDDDFAVGDALDFENSFGMAYGLNVGYNMTDNFGIHAGVLVSSQGQRYVTDILGNDFNSQIDLNYLKVPVLLKLNSNPSSTVGFLFQVGPQFSFLNSATYTNDLDVEQDLKETYKSMAVELTFSLGTRIMLADALSLDISLRPDYSLTNIEDESASTTLGGIGIPTVDDRAPSRNLTAGILVGVNYHLGR